MRRSRGCSMHDTASFYLVPAVCVTDPWQDAAEPLNKASGISGKTSLRKGRKYCLGARSEGKRNVRNSSASTKVKELGEEVLQVQEQRLPWSLWRRSQ